MPARSPTVMGVQDDLSVEWSGVHEGSEQNGIRELQLLTNAGTIDCRLHQAPAGGKAILWVFGAGGGLGGPAGGLYARLAEVMVSDRVVSLRLDYRHPGSLLECVLDVLVGVEYLHSIGRHNVVLVGHSFGGAVVISAGVLSPHVMAVAALSSQTQGTEDVGELSPKPLLLVHGGLDTILPADCSRDIYSRAGQPKEIMLYPGCGHGLDDCRREIDRDLTAWLHRVLTRD